MTEHEKDDLEAWIRARGGVVRAADAVAAGFREHEIRRAVNVAALVRPRGGWVATRDADPLLMAAARGGVVTTCITEAKRLEVWTDTTDDRHHVGASPRSGGVAVDRTRSHVHWARPAIARAPGLLRDGIENVLVLIAACQPYEPALAAWQSAARKGPVDLAAMRRLPLTGAARTIAHEALPYIDSGLETYVLVRLRWLKVSIVPQAWVAGHRVDFLIGARLVLQVDGGHHVGPQRDADIAHDALLMTLGYHVIRVSYAQIMNDWPQVQHRIMQAVAQGLHRAA